MSELFKSPAAAQTVRDWHQRFRARLPPPVTQRDLTTRFGQTQVLVAGPENAPPVVALHGALASSAHLLGELLPLTEQHRVYCVDVIGQSVMSADTRLSVKNDAYGQWLTDVFDGLGLDRAALLGVSWGGFAAQRFAALAPQRLDRLALLVPAGMVGGNSWRGFVEMGWPMTKYLLAPSPARLRQLGEGLLTTLDDDWLPFIGDAFRAYDLRKMVVPTLSRPEEFTALTCPVLVIGAEHDVSFPGEKLVARAKQLFVRPGQLDTEVLAGVRHSPPTTDEFRRWLGARLTRFFSTAVG